MSETAEQTVTRFNQRHPIGQAVRYWTGRRGDESGGLSQTRTKAQVMAGGDAVVWVEDHVSCIALTHIEPR